MLPLWGIFDFIVRIKLYFINDFNHKVHVPLIIAANAASIHAHTGAQHTSSHTNKHASKEDIKQKATDKGKGTWSDAHGNQPVITTKVLASLRGELPQASLNMYDEIRQNICMLYTRKQQQKQDRKKKLSMQNMHVQVHRPFVQALLHLRVFVCLCASGIVSHNSMCI